MKHTYYIEDGSIYNSLDHIIENPGLIIDTEDFCIIKSGDCDNLNKYLRKVPSGYPLLLIELSAYKISREDACHILRRATEFSGTNFIKGLYQNLTDGTAVEWLKADRQKGLVDIYEKEWD